MVSLKKLIRMARKWQKMAAIGRKKISLPKVYRYMDIDSGEASSVAYRGHFVIYTTDQRRFMIPLVHLNNNIFRELFKMSEDEFGLSSDGPIVLPCDAAFMEYIVSLIQKSVSKDLEKALLNSITTGHCSLSAASFHQEHARGQLLVCGY